MHESNKIGDAIYFSESDQRGGKILKSFVVIFIGNISEHCLPFKEIKG
jgi:hypothetical protein